MFSLRQQFVLIVIAGALAFATAWGIGSRFGGPHAASQAAPSNAEAAPFATPAAPPPPLIPPGEQAYTPRSSSAPITAPDGRPVAQFAHVPASLSQSTSVNFPDSSTPSDPGVVSYRVLSSIRYQGNGHTVYVTTARPSLAAANGVSNLGTVPIQLSDGSTAWTDSQIPGSAPNQVRWLKDGLIITVAGDVTLDELKGFAAGIMMAH